MKNEIKMVCKDCKKEPEIDTEKSTKNWKRYKNSKKCLYCGGELKFEVK